MNFIKKLFGAPKESKAEAEMSSPEQPQEDEPMDVDEDRNFDQELETVDSPESTNFEGADNTTEDEEDAQEENRDPRSFHSTNLRPHAVAENNENSDEEEIESYSPAEENQVEDEHEQEAEIDLDAREKDDDDDEEEEEKQQSNPFADEDSNSGDKVGKDKEVSLIDDEDTNQNEDVGDSREKEDLIVAGDNNDNSNSNEDNNKKNILSSPEQQQDQENDQHEQEAEIDLDARGKEDEDDEEEEEKQQSNPFADEDSNSSDKVGKDKEISLIDDEDTNQNDDEGDSREKEDLFVAGDDNDNSNSNEDSNKKNIFVSGEDINEDSCDKVVSEKKDEEIEVLDIGDDSDDDEIKESTVKKSDSNGTEEHPVDLEADERLSKTSGENSPQLQIDEPEGSPQSPGKKEAKSEDENEEDERDMPKITISSGIFDQPAEDDDEDDNDNVDIQSMMQVEMMEDDVYSVYEEPDDNEQSSSAPKKPIVTKKVEEEEESPRRMLPRRAAARAAATTIKEISSHELEDEEGPRSLRFRGRRASPDRDYSEEMQPDSPPSPPAHPHRGSNYIPVSNTTPSGDKHKCHICKRVTTCPIVVRQFGSDVHMCSNSCFNTFRNPDPSKRPIPCAHCGVLNRDTDEAAVYYWETMNFCSDMCVAKYQIDVGGKCATCIKKVAWNCLGKYCVRFGSDIRQFCTATCLEAYKKNARVCFHCQLDIKRLGNVVLANIPAKASPKEFCSQDCVEMYIEQNLKQMVRPKPGLTATCVMCGCNKEVYKEMCTSNATYKICSDYCWRQLLSSKSLNKPAKCESCAKYINLEVDTMPAAHYISTAARIHGFCSATCKNVFVLKNRSILACTSCKVKKYNFDLIEFISNKSGASGFAVCSLNCIPKGAQYIAKLKELYNSGSYNSGSNSNANSATLTASQLVTTRKSITNTVDSNTVPIISSVTSVTSVPQDSYVNDITEYADSPIQIQSVVTLADGETSDDNEMKTYDNYDDDENAAFEEVITELDEMKRLYEEVVQQLESVNEKDFCPDQRTVSCWVKPRVDSKETQTDMDELETMERIKMVPQEKIIYVPVPIPYPVLLPFPFYALETPVPYPFPVPMPVPVPIPVIFSGTPKDNANKSTKDNVELVAESCDDNAMESFGSDMDADSSPLPLNPPSHVLNDINKDRSNSPAGTSRIKTKPQILSDSGIKAWRSYFGQDSDPVLFKSPELGQKLVEFVNRVTRPNKEKYPADTILQLSLGIQQYLRDNRRTDYIFYDEDYCDFVQNFTTYAEDGIARGIVLNRIDESNFWETTELGAPSPGVLLFTVIYFNYKYFNLKTWEAHAALQFKDVTVVEREDMETSDKIKYLVVTTPDGAATEVEEKSCLRERCPVRLFEFYQLKCANQEGSFYKTGNKNYTPRNEWFSDEALDQTTIYRMVVRATMIKSEDTSR